MNGYNAPWLRLAFLTIVASLPACAALNPAPPNPFAGGWATAERQQIAFRDDTVVINPPGEKPTPLGAETCAGKFRFSYRHQNRDALLALVPRQPDLRRRLTGLLTRPDYDVAEVSCGEGSTTYVLLDDKDLVAIHSDHDIAGIERWSRL